MSEAWKSIPLSRKLIEACTGAELAPLMGGWSDEQGSPVYFVTCEFSGEEEEIIRHVPEKIPVPDHVEIIDELLR